MTEPKWRTNNTTRSAALLPRDRGGVDHQEKRSRPRNSTRHIYLRTPLLSAWTDCSSAWPRSRGCDRSCRINSNRSTSAVVYGLFQKSRRERQSAIAQTFESDTRQHKVDLVDPVLSVWISVHRTSYLIQTGTTLLGGFRELSRSDIPSALGVCIPKYAGTCVGSNPCCTLCCGSVCR